MPESGTERRGLSVYRRFLPVSMAAAAAALAYLKFGWNIRAAVMFLFFSILMLIAIIDISMMRIPDALNIMIVFLGIISIFMGESCSMAERTMGIFFVSVPMILLTLRHPGGVGGGDIKFMAACGFLLGWRDNFSAAFLGAMTAGMYSVILLILRKRSWKDTIAFGPFLCLGEAVTILVKDVL